MIDGEICHSFGKEKGPPLAKEEAALPFSRERELMP
jgi:hypothetical protein